ncbi:hypothetical protein K3H30_08355 [Aeromonas veronii]|uniref:hypothetical protein n=1 Tax=Aeromonas veronii TaxID=654 RepID=UPI001F235023|nr:hypothetical protein [Aeromonas veronii]MCF5717726.1 hypothetical protein [Aeromonas veronii]
MASWSASADRLGEKVERAAWVARFFIHLAPVWRYLAAGHQLPLFDKAKALSIDEQLTAAQRCASPLSG